MQKECLLEYGRHLVPFLARGLGVHVLEPLLCPVRGCQVLVILVDGAGASPGVRSVRWCPLAPVLDFDNVRTHCLLSQVAGLVVREALRHRLVGDVEQARVLRFQSSVDRFLRERSVLHFVGPASVGQPMTLLLDHGWHVQPPRFGCALASSLFQIVLLPSVPIGRLCLQFLQSERGINLDSCGRYLR